MKFITEEYTEIITENRKIKISGDRFVTVLSPQKVSLVYKGEGFPEQITKDDIRIIKANLGAQNITILTNCGVDSHSSDKSVQVDRIRTETATLKKMPELAFLGKTMKDLRKYIMHDVGTSSKMEDVLVQCRDGNQYIIYLEDLVGNDNETLILGTKTGNNKETLIRIKEIEKVV